MDSERPVILSRLHYVHILALVHEQLHCGSTKGGVPQVKHVETVSEHAWAQYGRPTVSAAQNPGGERLSTRVESGYFLLYELNLVQVGV